MFQNLKKNPLPEVTERCSSEDDAPSMTFSNWKRRDMISKAIEGEDSEPTCLPILDNKNHWITELILNDNLITIKALGKGIGNESYSWFYMRKIIITCQPSLSLRPLL